MSAPLTSTEILDAAEQVLRRFGPAKTTVVDVARALEVSHGTVYRHFPSKAVLRDAVTERWLDRVSEPLEAVVSRKGKAETRLRAWLQLLARTKQDMARADPEMFATFHTLTSESREVVASHLARLSGQLSELVAAGVASGEFAATDVERTGWAILQATARFHHPAHAAEWDDPDLDRDFAAVFDLVVNGLARPRG
ncbi:MAG: TetR family transcriptional regulator [Nocardioides sp.]